MAVRETTDTILTRLSDRLSAFVRKGTGTEDGGLFALVKEAVDTTAFERKGIQKLRDYYEGDQIVGTGLNQGEFYIPQWPGESDADRQTRSDRMAALQWNRIRDGILTHTDALYAWGRGRGVRREVKYPEGLSAAMSEEMSSYLTKRAYKRNNFSGFAWKFWRVVIAESRGLAMLKWADSATGRPRTFPPTADREAHRTNGYPVLHAVDNLLCLTLPHPEDPSELGMVIRWYRDPEDKRAGEAQCYPGRRDTITEFVTDELWVRWKGSKLTPTVWGTTNRYEDVRIPFVFATDLSGLSDMADAMGNQTLLLEHIYNLWEVSRNHAFPETLFAGYDPPTKEVDGQQILLRGPNIAHQADDPTANIQKVSPSMSAQDLGYNDELIHSAINEAMGVSFMDRGTGSDLGQLRSAPALARIQAKSERRRRRKILAAMKFEMDLGRAFLLMWGYHGLGSTTDEPALRTTEVEAQFPEDAFTMDPFTEAQKDQVEVTSGMTERRDQVAKRHPDLSEEELDAKMVAIEADLEATKGQDLRDPDPSAETRSAAQEDA